MPALTPITIFALAAALFQAPERAHVDVYVDALETDQLRRYLEPRLEGMTWHVLRGRSRAATTHPGAAVVEVLQLDAGTIELRLTDPHGRVREQLITLRPDGPSAERSVSTIVANWMAAAAADPQPTETAQSSDGDDGPDSAVTNTGTDTGNGPTDPVAPDTASSGAKKSTPTSSKVPGPRSTAESLRKPRKRRSRRSRPARASPPASQSNSPRTAKPTRRDLDLAGSVGLRGLVGGAFDPAGSVRARTAVGWAASAHLHVHPRFSIGLDLEHSARPTDLLRVDQLRPSLVGGTRFGRDPWHLGIELGLGVQWWQLRGPAGDQPQLADPEIGRRRPLLLSTWLALQPSVQIWHSPSRPLRVNLVLHAEFALTGHATAEGFAGVRVLGPADELPIHVGGPRWSLSLAGELHWGPRRQ